MKGLSLNMKNLRVKNVNWFALVGGALTLVLAVSSTFVPWWQITVGQTLVRIGISPVHTSTNIVGYDVALPIIAAIGWMFMAMLVSVGIVLVAYSIIPTKPYSKRLLGFAYKKPLGTLITFTILMLIVTNAGTIIGTMLRPSTMSGADLNVPWSGAKTLQLNSSVAQGTVRGIAVSAEVEWTFWLAVTVAALCIAARVYHKKLDRPAPIENAKQPSQDAA
jgi:hypothetical protein